MEQNNLKLDWPQAGEVEADFSNFQMRPAPEDFRREIMVDFKVTPEPTTVWDGSELNKDR
jgi:hypothetical protein